MLDTLQGTPLWVYGVFLLVCYYGLRARTPSRESELSLLITPGILTLWSFFSLNYNEHAGLALGSWIAGIALGSLAAIALFSHRGVTLDSDGKGLIVPGSWKIFCISLLFFAVKYFIGYQAAVHPERSASVQMLALTGTASGFTVGLFCGRATTLYRKLMALRALKNASVA
ncbi:hypothetical protein BLL42_18715 [Pseudomonas frederiksbergensis]|uniref:DUF1453 domain-containing protein n=1 Tax=Pseudomonas frederiksbergensis TaxID=104087 RepID=A0A1J0ENN7_9PSED|nr:hypothetical protein [Pseudomonas frederiksbergensis]APC17662.1 hypothetical protein BLL42_18715 [Pseudomonas frederiksbergensis]